MRGTIGRHQMPRSLFEKLMDSRLGTTETIFDARLYQTRERYSWRGVPFWGYLEEHSTNCGQRRNFIFVCKEGLWSITITVTDTKVMKSQMRPEGAAWRYQFFNRRTIQETAFEGSAERFGVDIMLASVAL